MPFYVYYLKLYLGLHFSGTKNLCAKFESHDLEKWRRASKLDNLLLNSENQHEVAATEATKISSCKGMDRLVRT